jgi:hypothetical protein
MAEPVDVSMAVKEILRDDFSERLMGAIGAGGDRLGVSYKDRLPRHSDMVRIADRPL